MSGEIYEAHVAATTDPLGQGRIKVLIPQVAGGAVSAWAAPTVRTHGPAPIPGSTVWVSLDVGDASKPVYHAGPVYSPWAAPAAAWLAAGWSAGTAQYRLGPGGQVQWRGALATSSVVFGASTAVLTGALPVPAVPAYAGVVLLTPTPVLDTLLADTSGNLTWVGGAVSYTGTAQLFLNTLSYSTL